MSYKDDKSVEDIFIRTVKVSNKYKPQLYIKMIDGSEFCRTLEYEDDAEYIANKYVTIYNRKEKLQKLNEVQA